MPENYIIVCVRDRHEPYGRMNDTGRIRRAIHDAAKKQGIDVSDIVLPEGVTTDPGGTFIADYYTTVTDILKSVLEQWKSRAALRRGEKP